MPCGCRERLFDSVGSLVAVVVVGLVVVVVEGLVVVFVEVAVAVALGGEWWGGLGRSRPCPCAGPVPSPCPCACAYAFPSFCATSGPKSSARGEGGDD